jgi:hypothetical protein
MVRAGHRAAILGVITLAATPARAQSDAEGGVAVDVPAGDAYADTDPSALTDFRPALDPYGSWLDDPTYGTAWTPAAQDVGADFTPYESAGHWDYAGGDYSWTSDYAWGWVCFHYGRWVLSAGRWLWIPGREYAAAWVEWRVGDETFGYVGWSPMPPAYGWADGSAVGLGFASVEPWAFAAYVDLLGLGLGSRVVVGAPAAAMLPRTRPYVRAQPVISGPPARAQAATHGPPPAALGIDLSRVPPSAPNPREARARQLARPSTALALGARPPAPHVVRVAPARMPFAAPHAGHAAGTRAAPRGHR